MNEAVRAVVVEDSPVQRAHLVEASSVVFGMPKAARQLGAAAEVLGLARISGGIRNAVARLVR